jgi:hypothetical protein
MGRIRIHSAAYFLRFLDHVSRERNSPSPPPLTTPLTLPLRHLPLNPHSHRHYFTVFYLEERIWSYVHLFFHICGHVFIPLLIHIFNGDGWRVVASISLGIVWVAFMICMRKLRWLMKSQHRNQREVEKTLESFFGESASALMLVMYVFFEAIGCVEEPPEAGCAAYFVSARMFSNTMIVPLVVFVSSHVADLRCYDIMRGNLNNVVKLGISMLVVTGFISLFAFSLREYSLEPSYEESKLHGDLFCDVWEVFQLLSVTVFVFGILRDFMTDKHKQAVTLDSLRTLNNTEYLNLNVASLDGLSPHEKQELEHRRRMLYILKEQKNQDRRLGGEKAGNKLSRRKKLATLFKEDIDEDNQQQNLGLGVHYRASRGMRVSSNWTGLIV